MAQEHVQPAPEPQPGPLGRYLRDSRAAVNTVCLILPLFLIYSVGVQFTGGIQNGVDLLSSVVRRYHFIAENYLLINAIVLVVFLLVLLILRNRGSFRPGIYGLVILEGAGYGVLLGAGIPAVLTGCGVTPATSALSLGPPLAAAARPLDLGPLDRLVLSCGAGVWEEIVFRFLLLGGLYLGLVRVLRIGAVPAWLGATLVSSLAFAAAHYVGSLADTLELYGFLFRFLAGVVFATVFLLRGLAVVVYTHAVYDVMVMLLLAR